MNRRRLGLLPLLASLALAGSAASASGANFPAQIDLPDGFSPEGITTGAGNRLYVGSLGGALWAGNARTGTGSVIAPAPGPSDPPRVVVGVDYDESTGFVWAAGGPLGQVHVFDGRTGDLLHTYQVTGDVGFLNDVVVTNDAVYVTDSNFQQLIVIDLPADGSVPSDSALSKLPLVGELSFSTGFNANGIVAARGWLILVQTNEGLLFRVDPSTGDTVEIERKLGGFSATSGTILTADGLELRGSTLYVVRNNADGSTEEAVLVHQLGAQLTSARLLRIRTSAALDVSTTATLAAGRLWVVNARFGSPGPDYWLTRLPAQR